MKTIIALLGLAATYVTAGKSSILELLMNKHWHLQVPTAQPKFTLAISSNQTDINGLGLVDARNSENTMGELDTMDSLDEKPTVFWLEPGTNGRLFTESNGTLRHAWTWDEKNVGAIQFDQEGGQDGRIYPIYFEITSDKLLVPSGKYKGFPWYFCPTDVDLAKRKNYNLGGWLMLGESGCTSIHGLSVTEYN